jgi:hypothetical protein
MSHVFFCLRADLLLLCLPFGVCCLPAIGEIPVYYCDNLDHTHTFLLGIHVEKLILGKKRDFLVAVAKSLKLLHFHDGMYAG